MFVGMLYIERMLSDSVDCAVVMYTQKISLVSCKDISSVFRATSNDIGHW